MEQTCFSVMFWIINMLYWPYHFYFINSTLPCSMKTSQYVKECTAVKVKVAQSSPTFCNPMHYAVHGILQARILEWVGFPFSRNLPNLGIELPHCRWILYQLSQGKPKNTGMGNLSLLQWIFLTLESNRGHLYCRRILYQLSYEGSPWLWSSEKKLTLKLKPLEIFLPVTYNSFYFFGLETLV